MSPNVNRLSPNVASIAHNVAHLPHARAVATAPKSHETHDLYHGHGILREALSQSGADQLFIRLPHTPAVPGGERGLGEKRGIP
jgi:hypothetical protein